MSAAHYVGYVDGEKRILEVEYDDLNNVTLTRHAFEEMLISLARPFYLDEDDE